MRRLLSEMFWQPASAFASAARMLTHRVQRGMRVDAIVSRAARALSRAPMGGEFLADAIPCDAAFDGVASEPRQGAEAMPAALDYMRTTGPADDASAAASMPAPGGDDEVTQTAATITHAKEDREMDKDLRDDMLKLVRYKVLFVKREYEHAFAEREDLVSDNLDGNAFTAWKVAEFIQELGRGATEVPAKWREKGYPAAGHRRGGALVGLAEEDKKYLRVYYEVLERYPREKFKYEEQQIRVLEQIRDAVEEKQP